MHSLLEAFWSGGLAPLGDALVWRSQMLWAHAFAHGVIALAFLISAFALSRLIRLPGFAANAPLGAVALFVAFAGVLNLVAIWGLWHPAYLLLAGAQTATALAVLGTALALWQLRTARGAAAEPVAAAVPTGPSEADLAAINEARDAAVAQLSREIVLREQAEEALLQARRLEAVGRLTGGVAHDFNNLLQAVAGNLELIARKPDDADRVVRWSGSALDAVERGRALVGQLLAFSRKQRIQVASTRLTTLVAGVRDLLERAVAPLGQVELQPIDPTLNVQADPLQLELAMLNLAFSARDAMPDGGVLTVSAERRRDAPGLPAGDYVAMTLRSSTGAADDDAAGLSMAHGVLAQMGGTLAVEQSEDRHWQVTLFLRVATSEPAREMLDDAAGDERIDLNGYTIALVDDDMQVRATLAEMLIAAGAEVTQASDGVEGVELVRRAPPHLLVVDFGMPGMSGAEVVRQVRTEYPQMPALLVTGLAEVGAVAAVRGPGIGVLQKPFEAQQLVREVKALIAP
jgi:signal transduction histidine kinase